MANADITRLMSNLRIHLPGAVDGSIKLEVYNALNKFFQGSNSWREDIEIAVTPDGQDYELIPSGPCNIVRLMGVADSNQFPIAATLDVETRNIVFSRPISDTTTYFAQVALTVAEPLDREGYPVCPEWLLDLYSNDIISGVLSRMLIQPAKPYTNLPLAEYHGAQFRSAISRARSKANRKYTYRAQAWAFPRGWSSVGPIR